MQNATTAINTVVKNLVLGPEDIILSNSHSYNACNNAIDSAVQRCSADTLALDLRYREGKHTEFSSTYCTFAPVLK